MFSKTHRYRFAIDFPLWSVFPPHRSVLQSRYPPTDQHSGILLRKYAPPFKFPNLLFRKYQIYHRKMCSRRVGFLICSQRFDSLTSFCTPCKIPKNPVCAQNHSFFLAISFSPFSEKYHFFINVGHFARRKGLRGDRSVVNRALSRNTCNPHRFPQFRSRNCPPFLR